MRLRDAILRHLRDAGSDSISGVARALASVEGSPVHRLTITGHLAAMTEEGTLREVERPPSKHYQVEDGHQPLTIHEQVGAVAGSLDVPAPDRAAVAAAILSHLYGRPIFLAELKAAGFANPSRGMEAVDIPEDQRRLLRHLFRDDGPHPLDIPRADPLLHALPAAVSQSTIHEGIRRLALDATRTHDLTSPAGATTGRQARLDLGGQRVD